jgi:starvation-inducible outer membrane lipoprotein
MRFFMAQRNGFLDSERARDQAIKITAYGPKHRIEVVKGKLETSDYLFFRAG